MSNFNKISSAGLFSILMASSLFTMPVSASSTAQPQGITSLDTSTEAAPDSSSTMCDKNGMVIIVNLETLVREIILS